MKVVAINGSSNRTGNTARALDEVQSALQAAGIECVRLDIGSKPLHGCVGCGTCFGRKDRRCVFKDDPVNDWLEMLFAADGLVIGSPTYYAGINGALKSLLDRAFFVAGANGSLFRHKVGAAVAAVRRAGSLPALEQINKYFTISEMIVAAGNYWSMAFGLQPGEAESDLEGMQCMRVMGENMAWIMKLIEHGRAAVPPPAAQAKIPMNFIRP